jgi:hypothetical protein
VKKGRLCGFILYLGGSMKKLLFLFLVLLAGFAALSANPAQPPGDQALEAVFSGGPLEAVFPEAAVLVPALFVEPPGILSAEPAYIVPAGEPSVLFLIDKSPYTDHGPRLIGAFAARVDYPLRC